MIQIKFKAQGANSAIGSFTHGDIARVGEALARHLVTEAQVAEYVQPQPPSAAAIDIAQPEQTNTNSAIGRRPRRGQGNA